MKRLSNIYDTICSVDNLRLAEKKARKGKKHQPGVKLFDRNSETNLLLLNKMLLNKTYKTSEYTTFKVYEPKEREVYRLPYYPDRITHHAVMNVLEPMFVSTFTADTYSCIKGRGIGGATSNLRRALKNKDKAVYYVQFDVKKFYPNVDHAILKQLLRRKIKDQDLLWLLDEIIDSAPGLPIGNYLSQYLGNFYLSYLDHYIKEELKAWRYFRYCDDGIVLDSDKARLHELLFEIRNYLKEKLGLTIKGNYRVRPVWTGINAFGYVHFPDHTLLRPSIKRALARAVAKNPNSLSVPSYYGWAKNCNSKNLLKKLCMTKFSELNIKAPTQGLEGDKIEMYKILNKEIKVLAFDIKPSKFPEKGNGKCLHLQVEVDTAKRVVFTGSGVLMDTITQIPKDKFPVTTTIIKENERFQFT